MNLFKLSDRDFGDLLVRRLRPRSKKRYREAEKCDQGRSDLAGDIDLTPVQDPDDNRDRRTYAGASCDFWSGG